MNMKWGMPQRPSTLGYWFLLVAMYAVVILCYPASFAIDAETFRRLGWEGGIETTYAAIYAFFAVFSLAAMASMLKMARPGSESPERRPHVGAER
jgi:hypothetical protein